MTCHPSFRWILVLVLLVTNSVVAQQDSGCVRVFVLAGQSNMQGHGVVDLDSAEHYNGGKGSLVQFLGDKENQARFSHLQTEGQWSSRNDVLVSCQTRHGNKSGPLTIGFSGYEGQHHIGPELQFGHLVGDFYEEPVLLIKTAWGGKSLIRDFRPPSAVAARGGEVGEFYQKMLAEVSGAIQMAPTRFPELPEGVSFEISGFVWQQGWNDMIDEAARNEYHANLVDLINDVRKEWNRPNLPVVVGELGNGGPDAGDSMKHFRRQQSRIAAHPPFVGNVAFAPTAQHARAADQSPNQSHLHHWFGNAESYLLVGDSLGRKMTDLVATSDLPRVLILGDSISIGYTPAVQQALSGTARVWRPMNNHRAAENCAGTLKGVAEIDRWLSIGGGQWDVIHFNFGLHDLKRVDSKTGKNSNNPDDPNQSPPDAYSQQLQSIVARLKTTGAKLIFATTTPVPAGGVRPYRAVDDPVQYNELARAVMEENSIEVNDLFEYANQRLEEIQQPVNVHFSADGSKQLADVVTSRIRAALESRKNRIP